MCHCSRPRYQDYQAADIPVATPEGMSIRVMAGAGVHGGGLLFEVFLHRSAQCRKKRRCPTCCAMHVLCHRRELWQYWTHQDVSTGAVADMITLPPTHTGCCLQPALLCTTGLTCHWMAQASLRENLGSPLVSVLLKVTEALGSVCGSCAV